MKQTGIEKVSIRLKSEIDGNTTEYRYSGEYQWKDGGHCIAYIDYMGNALTKVGVEANEKMMLLHRVGYVTSDMLFDPEAETIVKYDASSLKSGFVLKTHGYKITEDETKLFYYLSRHHDDRVEHFFLLSPANLTHMMSHVTDREKQIIKTQVERGDGDKMLPFPFMGWVECIANTAYDWQFSGLLNNVHTSKNGNFSQAGKITHTGGMLVGTYDNFTDGDPAEFLRNLNAHMPTAEQNKLVFIENTGHTYQRKHQEVADVILQQLEEWRCE